MPSVIEAENLQFAYVRVPVLEGVSFSVQAGDYVGIIGPNGGGKTTLLKLLLGLEKGKGQIKLFGQPLDAFKEWYKIGYLAQKSPVAQSRFPVSAEEWAAEHHPEEAFKGPYRPKQAEIIPIRGKHFTLPVLGYRFGSIAYLTDMNFIPESEFQKLEGLDHFIINCVRRGKHISHFSLEEAVEVAGRVGARHSWLTHLSHQLPRYEDLCKELPENIRPAYDGLAIEA